MSVFNKIPAAFDSLKNFDKEKPTVTVESDEKIIIENYNTIRLFSDEEISVEFESFVLSVEGEKLIMNRFTPGFIDISGKVEKITYLDRRHPEVQN